MQDSIKTFRQSRHDTEERLSVRKQFSIVFVPVFPENPNVYPVDDNMYRGSLGTESMGILDLLHVGGSQEQKMGYIGIRCSWSRILRKQVEHGNSNRLRQARCYNFRVYGAGTCKFVFIALCCTNLA